MSDPIGVLDIPPSDIALRDATGGVLPAHVRSQAEELTARLGDGIRSGTISSQRVRAALSDPDPEGLSLSPESVAAILRDLAHHGSSDSVRWRAAQSALELHRVLSEEATLYAKLVGADREDKGGDTHNHLHLHAGPATLAIMEAIGTIPEVGRLIKRIGALRAEGDEKGLGKIRDQIGGIE